MCYRSLGNSGLNVSALTLGTWAFGGDSWWGKQEDSDSTQALDYTLAHGITTIDTAPIYGRGRSERLIGDYLAKRKLRSKIILATKLGLNWHGAKIFHHLEPVRMHEEFDQSRVRLKTDYFDLYQIHWPDPVVPIGKSAQVLHRWYQKGLIKAIGVSNYSIEQMREFMNHCPLHSLQPEYSMFQRSIEGETVEFCRGNNIAILSYSPLYSGLLTGKFFIDAVPIPEDINRRMKKKHFSEPLFSINKEALQELKRIADNYQKTLTQLVINWNFHQPGITSAIVGIRNRSQAHSNIGSAGWTISDCDLKAINEILCLRAEKINQSGCE